MSFSDILNSRSPFRKVAQSFIWNGVSRGMKSTTIVNMLRKAGLSYHRQTMFQDVSFWRNAFAKGSKVKYTNRNKRFSPSHFVPAPFKIKGKYQMRIQITEVDPLTNTIKTTPVTWNVGHDENGQYVYDTQLNGTRGEYEQRFMNYIRNYTRHPSQRRIIGIMPVMIFERQ